MFGWRLFFCALPPLLPLISPLFSSRNQKAKKTTGNHRNSDQKINMIAIDVANEAFLHRPFILFDTLIAMFCVVDNTFLLRFHSVMRVSPCKCLL